MTDISPPNSIRNDGDRKNAKRLFRSAFLIALIAIVATICYSIMKFTSPAYREFRLDLKNGSTLIANVPQDWANDNAYTDYLLKANRLGTSRAILGQMLILKRSKPRGVEALMQDFIQRNVYDPIGSPRIEIDCTFEALQGLSALEDLRVKGAKDEWNFMQRGVMRGDIVSKQVFDNTCPLGPSFHVTSLSPPTRMKIQGRTAAQYKYTCVVFYIASPDNLKIMKICVSSFTFVGNDTKIDPVLQAVAKSLRIVPTVK